MIFLTAFTWLTATDVMIFIPQDKHFDLSVLKLFTSQKFSILKYLVKTCSHTTKHFSVKLKKVQKSFQNRKPKGQ